MIQNIVARIYYSLAGLRPIFLARRHNFLQSWKQLGDQLPRHGYQYTGIFQRVLFAHIILAHGLWLAASQLRHNFLQWWISMHVGDG